MKYRKRPSVVEAFRLGCDNIPDWFMDKVTMNEVILHRSSFGFGHHCDVNADIIMPTGVSLHANFGDYIVKSSNGDLYPYKPHVFKKIFEPDCTDQERYMISVNDIVNTTPISFSLHEILKRFEDSEYEDDKIIYNLLKRSKEMWDNLRINGLEMYGMSFEEFCDICKEKRNIVFLTDAERKNLNKAFEIMRILNND